MSRLPERTHITLLHERCQKLGTSPAYNETALTSPPESPLFACECTALGRVARGEGRNKKEAKHAAAKMMLNLLNSDLNANNADQNDSIHELTSCSPYENKLKGNEIGALTDLCAKHELDSPIYNPVREEGPSHDRRFTERCYVGCLGVEATDKKKKEAKQLVAHEMRSKLDNMINPRANIEIMAEADDDDDDDDEDNREFALVKSKFEHSESNFVVRLHPGDLTTRIIDNHLRYKGYYDVHKDLIDRCTAEFWENPEEKLDNLLEKMEIRYTVSRMSCKTKTVKMVAITIDMTPPLNVIQVGRNYNEAARKAAKTALQFLGILCITINDDLAADPMTRNQFEELVKASGCLT